MFTRMENKINVAKQKSLPESSEENRLNVQASFLSSATHPSMFNRNKDDLFKRIRSGNDVLCHLPSRLDPNLQFSDDEEEEEEEDENEANVFEVEKTPEFRSKSPMVPLNRFPPCSLPTDRGQKYPSIIRQPFSACKPLSFAKSAKIVPQSDSKAKTAVVFSDPVAKSKMNLMSQPEFKVPFGKPLPLNIPLKKAASLTDETIEVNNKPYSVLSLLGTGGSCKVFSVFDLNKKSLVAIKCVTLTNTDTSIREGYKKEIEYLQKLQGSNRVIKMFDYEYRNDELFIVLERGDIDFAKYISNEAKLKRLSPLMIKFYWAQMLEAVADIHKYGIVHSDLKPANFLLVAGNLKLIDFGIATAVPDDKTSILRDTQVGTLNYMSPEAITQQSDSAQICFKVGVKSDVWSLGCMLYNLVYGVTPFHNVKVLFQKIQAITNPNYAIEFRALPDENLFNVLKKCLIRDPKERASVDELLKHPYITDNKAQQASSETVKATALDNVIKHMQHLTPRRMNYLTKIVEKLAEN